MKMIVKPESQSVLSWLETYHPVLYNLLLLTDEFYSGIIFQDTATHTISWHIACMCQAGNPIAKLACNALNGLSPDHCQTAIQAEGPCPNA
jgi:hypothetical protein